MSTIDIKSFDQYLVKEASRVKLNEISANPWEQTLNKQDCNEALSYLQKKLIQLQEKFFIDRRRKFLIVLQGMDTSGKNSTIRNVFRGFNPQFIHVASFEKPTKKELSYDFLWRVHQNIPASGEIVVFDRSHYEDVLAVRVNELCEEAKWRKRFQHINNFEQLLVDEGTIILKFYLHIDREEQKSRLQQRINLPHKNWKFDPSDLVARNKWELYESAYEEVFEKTSLSHAPWYIIPANKKWSRNLLIAQIICATLDDLHLTYPKVKFNPDDTRIT